MPPSASCRLITSPTWKCGGFEPSSWISVKHGLPGMTSGSSLLLGSGNGSVVERRTRDPTVHGWEFRQEQRENFLLQGHLSVLTLFSVSVPPPCYRSSTWKIAVILPKVQVAGYSYTRMHHTHVANNYSDSVNWCLILWCTQNLRRDARSFRWHQKCKNQRAP